MRRLDREETEAKATNVDVPTVEEAVEHLGDLARLWDQAEGSGRKQLAEALFERIDVLGARKLNVHPSAAAKAQGWAEAWNGARLVVMVGARGLEPTHTVTNPADPCDERPELRPPRPEDCVGGPVAVRPSPFALITPTTMSRARQQPPGRRRPARSAA
jgi:hypothetical protein